MSRDVSPSGREPMYAYPRSTVDDFVRAAEAEKGRLAAVIAENDERSRRARAAIGMHNMMVSMLIETQIELKELRAAAERDAAEIIGTAEEQSRAIIAAAATEADDEGAWRTPTPKMAEELGAPPRTIDLVGAEREQSCFDPRGGAADSVGDVGIEQQRDDVGVEYFAFLRQALTDDEPLGPRNP